MLASAESLKLLLADLLGRNWDVSQPQDLRDQSIAAGVMKLLLIPSEQAALAQTLSTRQQEQLYSLGQASLLEEAKEDI